MAQKGVLKRYGPCLTANGCFSRPHFMFHSAPRFFSCQCLFICDDVRGAQSPNEEAPSNEASLTVAIGSSDMTVDQPRASQRGGLGPPFGPGDGYFQVINPTMTSPFKNASFKK